MLMSPSVLTKVSVTPEPRGTLRTAPVIWNLVDLNGSRRKVSFLQISQSLGEGSKPQRRERECITEGMTAEPQLSSSPWLTSPINLCLFLGAKPSTRAYGAGTGEPLGTHKSDPACRSGPQTLDAPGVTAGASARPRSAFSASISASETCRSHRGLRGSGLNHEGAQRSIHNFPAFQESGVLSCPLPSLHANSPSRTEALDTHVVFWK